MSAPWLINKPASPSIWDDEFESETLDPKWVRTGSAASASEMRRMDPYYASAISTNYVESLNKHRPSWYMAQPPSPANVSNGIEQQGITLPNECFVWMRASTSHRKGVTSDGEAEVILRLYNGATGLSDYIMASLDSSALTNSGFVGRNVGGGFTIMGLVRNYLGEATPVEYLGIQKIGTTFHGWCAGASGNWIWMNTFVLATTMYDRIALCFSNNSVASPGRAILGVDFLRVYQGRGPL